MQWKTPKHIFAEKALTSAGWQEAVLIGLKDGLIESVTAQSAPPTGTPRFPLILPGMSNVHSHAFQRAMAGLTEYRGGKEDDNFWSWREVMYDFLGKFTPDDVESTATALYTELLKQGYTSIGEFHYLHNDASGNHYSNPAEMSERIIAAAKATGIHLTLLPVLYETADFGGKPAHDGQKRFTHTTDRFLELLQILAPQQNDSMNLGIAPHSLRAVPPESLERILAALPELGLDGCPIHIHISEQEKEVKDCISWSGKRPVEWLLEHHDVSERWCLIHATHMNEAETQAVAKSGAAVGLCPTTEANLGDGIFPAPHYLKAGGTFGVGSDSNMCVSPFEELKCMEYAQRLSLRKRAVLCSEGTPSVGRTLFEKAATGGAQALGNNSGAIAVGKSADLIAAAMDHPLLENKTGDNILDTLIFATTPTITDVFVGGRWIIRNNT